MERRMLAQLVTAVTVPAMAVSVALGALGMVAAPSARADGITPLTLDLPAAGEVFSSDSAGVFIVVFAGLGAFGDPVTVTDPTGTALCASTVQDDGTWTCTADAMPDFFGQVTVTDSVTTLVRLLGAVNPPRLDPSQSGGISTDAADFVTLGTAAPGALVDLFRNDEQACSTVADQGGGWTCALALTDADVGTALLTGTQTPPYAARASAPSPAVSLVYRLPEVVIPVVPSDPVDPGGPATPVDPATPGSTASETPGAPASPDSGPVLPADGASAAPDAVDGGAAGDGEGALLRPGRASSDLDEAADAGTPTGIEPGRSTGRGAPAPVGTPDDVRRTPERSGVAADPATGTQAGMAPGLSETDGWNEPTGFGTTLRPFGSIAFDSPAFAVSVSVLVAGFVLVLALPAELLQSTIRENYHRIAPRVPRLLRLRRQVRRSPAGEQFARRVGPVAARGPVAIMLVTALVSAFADPSTGLDARSLRLALALTLVMLIVNGVGIASGGLHAARRYGARIAVSARPATLLLVVATVLVSRFADLQPGLLFGLVLGVEFGTRMRAGRLARTTIVTSCSLLALGSVSWIAFGLFAPAWQAHPDFGNQLIAEVLTGVAVEALTGLVIALLPLTFLDGHTVFSASKAAWAALYSVVLTVFVVIILPVPSSWVQVPSLASPWALASAVFALVGVLTWAAFRFITPRMRIEPAAGEPPPEPAVHPHPAPVRELSQ
jgi:hypothetical protein